MSNASKKKFFLRLALFFLAIVTACVVYISIMFKEIFPEGFKYDEFVICFIVIYLVLVFMLLPLFMDMIALLFRK